MLVIFEDPKEIQSFFPTKFPFLKSTDSGHLEMWEVGLWAHSTPGHRIISVTLFQIKINFLNFLSEMSVLIKSEADFQK